MPNGTPLTLFSACLHRHTFRCLGGWVAKAFEKKHCEEKWLKTFDFKFVHGTEELDQFESDMHAYQNLSVTALVLRCKEDWDERT